MTLGIELFFTLFNNLARFIALIALYNYLLRKYHRLFWVSGTNEYISKPIDQEALLDVLKRCGLLLRPFACCAVESIADRK